MNYLLSLIVCLCSFKSALGNNNDTLKPLKHAIGIGSNMSILFPRNKSLYYSPSLDIQYKRELSENWRFRASFTYQYAGVYNYYDSIPSINTEGKVYSVNHTLSERDLLLNLGVEKIITKNRTTLYYGAGFITGFRKEFKGNHAYWRMEEEVQDTVWGNFDQWIGETHGKHIYSSFTIIGLSSHIGAEYRLLPRLSAGIQFNFSLLAYFHKDTEIDSWSDENGVWTGSSKLNYDNYSKLKFQVSPASVFLNYHFGFKKRLLRNIL